MRHHTRRVTQALPGSPLLAGVIRPLPFVVMMHVFAIWTVACVGWIAQDAWGVYYGVWPAVILFAWTPLAWGGYWLHAILAGLLLTDAVEAWTGPDRRPIRRHAAGLLTAGALVLSYVAFVGVDRQAQAVLADWLRYPGLIQAARAREAAGDREGAQAGYEAAAAARPFSAPYHDHLAWLLLSEPDPARRDLGAARAHAEAVERMQEAYHDPFSSWEELRLHREVMAALAVLDGDLKKAYEFLDAIGCPLPVHPDGTPVSKESYRNDVESWLGWSKSDRALLDRVECILAGRPWDSGR